MEKCMDLVNITGKKLDIGMKVNINKIIDKEKENIIIMKADLSKVNGQKENTIKKLFK